ncbi:neuropeptide-like 4 isoform X3 [Aethina tumida]|uniref:neuropeptide-like 4 isoform X3 n=1 Tax=Aethina tumida TaxID=116153 RepID=UPI00096B4328|nr:neuropeptide-like 4 isoform X3 [Aethina tumida]
MFKFVIFVALIASVLAVPAPEPKPALITTSYSAPLISSAPLAYSASYSYNGYSGYYLPSAYASGYAYSPYSSYIV